MSNVYYNKQSVNKSDIKFVSKALKQNLITTGNFVKKFEKKISNLLKCKYTVSCSSGTAALHLAFMSIDLKRGDVIVMPAINFIASYNICRIVGAKVFLTDVDPISGQMTPETVMQCIKKNNLKKIKAIITMYLGGFPENVIEFYKIKKKLNCYLIEDACHAFGAKYFYNNSCNYIGSCKHSDISTFSFHPVKTITTGEGGAITTNNKKIFKKILSLRSHGIIKDKKQYWKYDIYDHGLNYRLSDINCALGLSQIKRMKKFISYRKKVYNFYIKEFKKYKKFINFFYYNKKNEPSYHLFLISLNFTKINTTKDKLISFLTKNKIFPQFHYIPIYKFYFNKRKNNIFTNSEKYFENTLSLPIFYNLDLKIQKKIINLIKIFISK